MIKSLLKNRLFFVGFFITFTTLIASICYGIFFNDHVPTVSLQFDENNQAMRPPYNPLEYPPFGTDKNSQNIFFQVLVGAKYTIGIAIVVAFARVFISFFIGTLMGLYFPRKGKFLSWISDIFNYFPVVILVYFCFIWLLSVEGGMEEGFSLSFVERMLFEITILICIALPSCSLVIKNEITQVLHNEFINGAKVLGANNWQLLKKHIMPFLKPQIWILFMREVIQVMLLNAHLGIFYIFFGGALKTKDFFENESYISLSSEWSGLIGNSWNNLWTGHTWIPLIPICAFTIIILAIKCMLEGIKEIDSNRKKEKYQKKDIGTISQSNSIDIQNISIEKFNSYHS